MQRRELELPPRHIYPPDEWRLVEKEFYPRRLAQFETLFTTANGYLGIRGAADEGEPAFQNTTLINGFHETWPIQYPESAHGFARTGQTIVNVTDAKRFQLYVDDEPFSLRHAHLRSYERALDMREGVLRRELVWELASGKTVSIKSRRLVSLDQRHLAAVEYEVTVLNADVPVVIISEMVYEPETQNSGAIDPRASRGFQRRALLPREHYVKDQRIALGHQTERSGMTVACAMDHLVETECRYRLSTECSTDAGRLMVSAEGQQGKPVRVTKFIAYHSSRTSPAQELCQRAERTLDRAIESGFGALLESQRRYVHEFWRRADIEIEWDPGAERERRKNALPSTERVQQVLHLNLFHILQATARAEGVSVPAKGVTGLGYEGHYFWDTEMYLMPFLTYTEPRISRNLLEHRYRGLDLARARAVEVNQKGALFPWRTISGEEASAYYAAGTAQYHINADIAYALRQYVRATGDEELLYDEGAEMLVETARLWCDLGFFSEQHDGRFCIVGVTGPDEYNTVVNNNTFTNLMARENLWYAAHTVEHIRDHLPDRYESLRHRTGLEEDELIAWRQAADRMYLPYDEKIGIHLQDDDFPARKPWPFDKVPPEKYPLLLHFHPLVIYRHQVIKQADVVLAMFLLGDEFPFEAKKRNFDYYDPLTTGDSSLSVSVQSIIARELGYDDKARDYLLYAALMDYADIGGNVKDGCHIASMGGTWMAIVYGVAGFRDYRGRFSFWPRLSKHIARLRFCLALRGSTLAVDLRQAEVTYSLRDHGGEVVIEHEGREVSIKAGAPVTLPVEGRRAAS